MQGPERSILLSHFQISIPDYGTTFDKSYDDLIRDSLDDTFPSKSPSNVSDLEGISHFLRHDSKFTMDHKGALHQGYIN